MTATAGQVDELPPLGAPDTSNPRATLDGFMRNTERGIELYRADAPRAEVIKYFQRAERTLDLRSIAADQAGLIKSEAGLLIYETLVRVGLPAPEQVPGKDQTRSEDLTRWRVPNTEIDIARVSDGPRQGEFLFTTQTVLQALHYYDEIKDRPVLPGHLPGTYEAYVQRPAIGVPWEWVDRLPRWCHLELFRNPAWKLLTVLIALGLGLATQRLLRRILCPPPQSRGQGRRIYSKRLLFVLLMALMPLLLDYLFNRIVGVRFELGALLSKLMLLMAAFWILQAIITSMGLLSDEIINGHARKGLRTNHSLVRISCQLVAIILGIGWVTLALEYLGMRLAPLLAGLGIGGLAVALAARPTLENVIGGFTLFADKPIKVGDYCKFGTQEGWIEQIGLRSTRVRTRDDSVISVPNADFSQLQIQNCSRRRSQLFHTTLGLRYETTPDQLRYVLVTLREMLLAHPRVSPDELYVRFRGFGAHSLDVEVFAHLRTRDRLTYRALAEDINLRIMDIISEAGSGFAFPSHTCYMARDSGLDAAAGGAAEDSVAAWRERGEMALPEFNERQRSEIDDSLPFPPPGSATENIQRYQPRQEL